VPTSGAALPSKKAQLRLGLVAGPRLRRNGLVLGTRRQRTKIKLNRISRLTMRNGAIALFKEGEVR